jgi:predicted acyltransferase
LRQEEAVGSRIISGLESELLGGKPVAAGIDPWFLFNVGCRLSVGAGAIRNNIAAFTDTAKYKRLARLKLESGLDAEQVGDFKSSTISPI